MNEHNTIPPMPSAIDFVVLHSLMQQAKEAYDKLDATIHRESYRFLKDFLESEYIGFESAFQFAEKLYSADRNRMMDENVAKIVISILKGEINCGNDVAMNMLGSLYYRGRSTGEPDYVKAREYYERACAYGNVVAMTNLAYIYYYGFGVELDYKKAYHLFMKGFLMGSDESAYKIGDMYRYGYYVDVDYDMAFNMYLKSITMEAITNEPVRGNKLIRIADCLFERIGTEIDYEEALKRYQMAECEFYKQIKAGDPYCSKYLDKAIARQEECRSFLCGERIG